MPWEVAFYSPTSGTQVPLICWPVPPAIPSYGLSSPTLRMELSKGDPNHRRPNPLMHLPSWRVRSILWETGADDTLKHQAPLRPEHSFCKELAGIRGNKDIVSINLQRCGHSHESSGWIKGLIGGTFVPQSCSPRLCLVGPNQHGGLST